MRKIIIVLATIFCGCDVGKVEMNSFKIMRIQSKDSVFCTYSIELYSGDFITFPDTCGKFKQDQCLKLIKK